jgi:hypothetical protein
LNVSNTEKDLTEKPIVLLDGVETLEALHEDKLVVAATKGDLIFRENYIPLV